MSNDSDDQQTAQERHFTKLQREIAVAAREQGADPEDNFRLRFAVRRARDANMPDDAIERAIEQGVGRAPGPDYKVETFEGYGSEGVAVLVETITDDRGRTATELEHLFEEHGGNLGDDGCVAWQFQRRGLIEVDAAQVDDPDEFMLEVIEMGGEELREPLFASSEIGRVPTYGIYCEPADLQNVHAAIEEASYSVRSASIVYEATQRIGLERDATRRFLGFFEKLREHQDVQGAYANWSSLTA